MKLIAIKTCSALTKEPCICKVSIKMWRVTILKIWSWHSLLSYMQMQWQQYMKTATFKLHI